MSWRSTSWSMMAAAPGSRWRYVGGVLVVAALVAGCGRGGGAADQATVTLVHVDGRGNSPTEGALTAVTVSDAEGEVVSQSMVVYPGRPEGDPTRRYELVRGLKLPAGRFILRFEILPCTGSCPDPATADASDLRSQVRDVCELKFEVSRGDTHEFVVTTPEGTATAGCRMA